MIPTQRADRDHLESLIGAPDPPCASPSFHVETSLAVSIRGSSSGAPPSHTQDHLPAPVRGGVQPTNRANTSRGGDCPHRCTGENNLDPRVAFRQLQHNRGR
jgi:hypothetical protein